MSFDAQELERDRQIDPSQLDVACVCQADVFYKWAERFVQAKAAAEDMEFALDVYEAKLQMKVRSNPEEFGVSNVTEAAVKAAAKCYSKYIDRAEKCRRARLEAELLSKVVVAMEQRKRMLELLVTLHGQEYFAGPSVPRDLVSAWQEATAARSAMVNERQAGVARKRVRRDD